MLITKATYSELIDRYDGNQLLEDLPNELLYLWREDYLHSHGDTELLILNAGPNETGFRYLFDLPRERNVAAFGTPIANLQRRDASRMAGHPLSEGPKYHRGHLIAHSIGGGTDINLLPQLASTNKGAFRTIEKLARKLADGAIPSLYFVRAIYNDAVSQVPAQIEQCLIQSPKIIHYAIHNNLL